MSTRRARYRELSGARRRSFKILPRRDECLKFKTKNTGGTMRRRDLLKAIPLLMTPLLARADTLPLRFIPNANLTSLDPIWTTALVAQAHALMIYDTLYALD